MAIPWDRWRGIRIGEARVPGPSDFDDPEAQPFEHGGDSGDDWQLVDAASSMLPFWASLKRRGPLLVIGEGNLSFCSRSIFCLR